MAADEAAWAELRRLYIETELPVTELCTLFNVPRCVFYRRVKSHKWRLRSEGLSETCEQPSEHLSAEAGGADQTLPGPVGEIPSLPKPPAPRSPARPPDTPEVRVARFFRLLDLQLDKMENRMISEEPQTAEDEARQVRTMNTAVTNMERLTDAAKALVKSGDEVEGAARGDQQLKAERLRREIAERLERLNAQWNAASKPE